MLKEKRIEPMLSSKECPNCKILMVITEYNLQCLICPHTEAYIKK